jgi:hypothetical protein
VELRSHCPGYVTRSDSARQFGEAQDHKAEIDDAGAFTHDGRRKPDRPQREVPSVARQRDAGIVSGPVDGIGDTRRMGSYLAGAVEHIRKA